MAALGRLPAIGDEVPVPAEPADVGAPDQAEPPAGWLLRVLALDGRRVSRARGRRRSALPEPRPRASRPGPEAARADPPARHDVRRGGC